MGEAVEAYNSASTRLEKAAVVNGIVEKVGSTGGRFLRHDEEKGLWVRKWKDDEPLIARYACMPYLKLYSISDT